jgi:hypothetical protein
MRKNIYLLLIFGLVLSCNQKIASNKIVYKNLTETQRVMLVDSLSKMVENDQKYRRMISLGITDSVILRKDNEMRKKSVKEYMAYRKTIKSTITEAQKDSLWKLQYQLDFKNHNALVQIIKEYGYPSKEQLKTNTDIGYQILLHPPKEIEPKEYLNKMELILKPEIHSKRLEPFLYANFVDNILEKTLKQPQLYGTNTSFNVQTMSEGLPRIKNIEETNKARKQIGLPKLKKGEYEIN